VSRGFSQKPNLLPSKKHLPLATLGLVCGFPAARVLVIFACRKMKLPHRNRLGKALGSSGLGNSSLRPAVITLSFCKWR
jgi:hypothetical protein